MTTLYKYLGGGSLPNVPARDITEQDVEEFAEVWLANGISEELLLSSGLYEKAGRKVLDKIQYGGSDSVPVDLTIEEKTIKPKTKKAAKEGE